MASKKLFSLGAIYPSDFLKPDEQPYCDPVELKLMMDENGLVHLDKTAPAEVMWGKRYWYRSSISTTMKIQLRDVVDSILGIYNVKPLSCWVDIAGNDGYLLSQVPKSVIRINIDPANDSFKNESEKICDLVIQDYFSADVFKKSKYGNLKASVVTVISMFYDLSDADTFLNDVYEIMGDDGLLCLQLSYSPLMIEQLEYSNICHEHYAYYSYFNILPLLENHGFQVMDVQLNNTNAGSFRLFVMKDNADVTKFGSATHRSVCQFRMESLYHFEKLLGLDESDIWKQFYEKINESKKQTIHFIKSQKARGKIIMGYGASTKFNTTLQYFGLTNEMITAIAERNPDKYGLVTVGTQIPIISEEEMRLAKPDFLLVGPAHFISEFKERESELLKYGTKFIVTMPKFEIIGYD